MSLSRSVFRRAVDGDSAAGKLARASGRDASLVEQLESRVLLAVDWTGAAGAEHQMGPELAGNKGVEQVAWHGGPVTIANGSWILSFDERRDAAGIGRAVEEAAAQIGRTVDEWSVIARGYNAVVRFDLMPSESSLERFAVLAGAEAIDPNATYQTLAAPDDPLFTDQQWLDNTGQFVADRFGWFTGFGTIGADIGATEAWDITTGSSDVIVAVIDTGVDLNHPDLAANIWHNPGEITGNGIDDDGNGLVDDVNGWDFGVGDNDPDDEEGHGTGSAGMIGAVGNNGIGVSGTAWTVSILPLKIADQFGNLTLSAIISSHDYLTMMIEDFGHNIVASNNSYGGFDQSFYADAPTGFDAERDAIERFIDTGATFVASAGNSAYDNDDPEFTFFPTSYNIPGLISVAATNPDDTLAGYSNYGAETVDLGAPGVGVLTTAMGGIYEQFGGTSAAGPVVVGAVALLKSYRPEASAVEIRQALIDGVDQVPALQGRVVSGGRLNLANSLRLIGLDGPVAIAFNPGPITSRIDPNTGLPIDTVTVTFNKDLDGSTLDSTAALLTFAGSDGEFGTGDDTDTLVPIDDVTLQSGQARVVDVALDLTGVPQQRLPLGHYRLTLYAGTDADPKFQDVDGNLLNGNSSAGTDETYDFEVVGIGGSLETNDTLATATPVAFDGSGIASFGSVTIGDGLHASLDVDIFKITLPKGGLITSSITAANRQIPSDLDSYLRLFDANGEELTNNDQFNGRDSALDYFVTTGGTYYIGVSGFPNFDYDPTLAGSGRSQSTGVYDIRFGYEQIADDRLTVASDLDEPKPVPAVGTQGTMSDTLTVTDARAIKDLNLRLDIDHTYVSDLEIVLISPDGTERVLFNRHGADGDDFENVLLDDEAGSSIVSATPPYSGSLRPTNGLNAFDGKSALGEWTLLIRDHSALNSGQLNSWSLEFTLENDIFGAFESNDTIATARQINEVSGTGSATRSAQIGDGGFGTLDRDIFRFTADAGATLNVTVTSVADDAGSDPTLNTALRLFDSSGAEIKAASPGGTLDATIASFVFPAGGTYYIAVSEGSNTAYDPFDVTTGSPAVTTGGYRLDLTVSPGISDAATVMTGTGLTLGVDDDGTFGARDDDFLPYGIRFLGTDFLRDETTGAGLDSAYGLTAGGYDFMNTGGFSATALPVSLTNESNPTNYRVTASGLFRDLQVERTMTLGLGDGFIVFDVLLTNTGLTDLTDIAWLESFDPNQGLNLNGVGRNTSNDVDSAGRYASAAVTTNQYPEGLTISLGAPAADSRAIATFYDPDSTVVRDPSQILELGVNDPAGASDDLMMALAYDIGTIGAGESTTLRYFIFLGESPDDALAMYDEVNAGTGEGHLTADSATPVTETLSNGETAPTLAYRYYYPAGFSSENIYSFVPMINPNSQATRVVVIAHYEVGERDDLIADFSIAPGARGGITTNTPETYDIGFGNAGGSLVRPLEPYALEIRSERPIAATFSYFDTFLLDGEKAAVGESFTSTSSTTWTFSSVGKAEGRFDFPVYLNTSGQSIKVTTTLLPTGGGDEIVLTQELGAGRRGGWNLSDVPELPDGEYGMIVEAEGEIVASLSSYDNGTTSGRISATGTIGMAGLGAVSGATPEGQIGINSTEEIVGVTNAGETDAVITFSFLFESGSAYRARLDVPARARGELDVATLPGFPAGEPYSIVYSSTVPVAMSLPTLIFNDGAGTVFSDEAYTLWAFGAGFRPQNGYDQNVTEYLRVFNPADEEVVIEITIRFDGNFEDTSTPLGQETFRRTVPARRVAEFDIHDFVTGDRRLQDTFYGITVKAASPVVSYLGRYDAFFPGAFGTLGVPLGLTSTI
jgi:subtilisin family serine protease/subtilisin-like proprotein convertase family protein